jgi:hypothetical protein
MKKESRMDYVESVYKRYRESSKPSKTKILDELCDVCKYNRKYAISKLRQLPSKGKPRAGPKRKRSKKYDHQVLEVVEKVWKAANYPWSLRLTEILRLWLPWIRKHYRTSPEIEAKLLSISPSTIDRALKDKKIKLKRRLYGRTKPGTLLRHKIPVRTDTWDVKHPGYLEADLVPHSGESGLGEFIFSLNLTDILSGWVETQAVMGKGQAGVVSAVEKLSGRVPFKVLGLDSDNGSEFINYHLFSWCEKKEIQFTRSRPYKKDDNAHIEQKNWTHVRKFMGWDRYDTHDALEAMNDLYDNELCLFMNLFQPSVKLKKVIRIGSRKKRLYDQPQTPLDRLLSSMHANNEKLAEFVALRESMDPFSLSERLNEKLEQIWSLAHYRPKLSDKKKQEEEKINGLSPAEKETLESIAQVFGITVYVRPRKDGDLVAIRHG